MYICDNQELTEGERLVMREEFEAMYCHRLNVYEEVEVTDEKTHVTEFDTVLALSDIPCRVIEQSITPATEGEPARAEEQIKILLAPEIDIPPGSIVEVFFHGHSNKYKRSGQPYIKSDTQTITLEIYRELV